MKGSMEFKGTKGEWIVEKSEIDLDYRSVYRVCTWNIPNQMELKANEKLISKALEMLEFIQSLKNDNKPIPDHIWNWRNDLIKETTSP